MITIDQVKQNKNDYLPFNTWIESDATESIHQTDSNQTSGGHVERVLHL